MLELKNPYPVISDGARLYYGGNQKLFSGSSASGYGCGLVAVSDLLLYLSSTGRGISIPQLPKMSGGVYSSEDYEAFAMFLARHYLPVIPRSGINGLTLMFGVKRFFRHCQLPYDAVWGFSGRSLFSRIDEMLSGDIPAIISVGPNFPNFWGKKRLNLYEKSSAGIYTPVCSTNSHYVTVTGIDENYLCISSWGKKYYIMIEDFKRYADSESADFLCNTLYIRHK